MTHAKRLEVVPLYHVPRSQVWEGSRGRQSGRVHLHINGRALCGVRSPWYPRDPLPSERRCSRCEARAKRDSIEWPAVNFGEGCRSGDPSDSLAESQAGLNGLSGSPNSLPKREPVTVPDRTVDEALDVLREALETAHHDGFCVWCVSALFEGKREHAPSCLHETGQDALAAVRAEIERLRDDVRGAKKAGRTNAQIAAGWLQRAEAAEARVRELRCELEEMKERTQLARDGKETAE